MTTPGISAVGFVVGLLIGLTSMGGAALLTPFLILVLGVRPVVAVGSDLAYGAITKVFGAWVHWRQDTVDLRVVRRLAMGSLPGGLVGARVIAALPQYGLDADAYVGRALGVVLLAVAVLLLFRLLAGERFRIPHAWLARFRRGGTVLCGAGVGFAVGLTSVGSGSLVAPFLMAMYGFAPPRVVGTDVFHGAVLVSASALGHVALGTIDWGLVGALLVGSLPGVYVGSRLSSRLPPRAVRWALAVMLLTTGLKLTTD